MGNCKRGMKTSLKLIYKIKCGNEVAEKEGGGRGGREGQCQHGVFGLLTFLKILSNEKAGLGPLFGVMQIIASAKSSILINRFPF